MTALSNANHALAARQRRSPAVYGLRLAGSAAELRAAQALRFEVFNLELGEGLVHSADSGLDADAHDAVCDHLIVSDVRSGQVVGTYRMQTGTRAAQGLGYYSEREFDFGPFEPQRGEILELGRACIHRKHRNFAVLNLLWTGIARYAKAHHQRPRDTKACRRQHFHHLPPATLEATRLYGADNGATGALVQGLGGR